MTQTVLLVDDDPAVLDVIANMLEEIGCNVIRGNGGPQALELLQHDDQISSLITDINMPRMVPLWSLAPTALANTGTLCGFYSSGRCWRPTLGALP